MPRRRAPWWLRPHVQKVRRVAAVQLNEIHVAMAKSRAVHMQAILPSSET